MTDGFPRLFSLVVAGQCLGVAGGMASVQEWPSAFLFVAVAVLIECGIRPLVDRAERSAPTRPPVVVTRIRRELDKGRAERVR